MPSIPDNQKKRGRPATGVTPLQGVRMSPELVGEIDAWAAQQPDRPSRAEAIRRLVVLGLQGRVRPATPDEGLRPQDLTSENDG